MINGEIESTNIMILINESAIIGKTFTIAADPTAEYTCIGVADNNTFLLVGTRFDSINNRSILSTIKLSEARFKGELIPVLKP